MCCCCCCCSITTCLFDCHFKVILVEQIVMAKVWRNISPSDTVVFSLIFSDSAKVLLLSTEDINLYV